VLPDPEAEEEGGGDELRGDGAPRRARRAQVERSHERAVEDDVCDGGERDGEERRVCVLVRDEAGLQHHRNEGGGEADGADEGVLNGAPKGGPVGRPARHHQPHQRRGDEAQRRGEREPQRDGRGEGGAHHAPHAVGAALGDGARAECGGGDAQRRAEVLEVVARLGRRPEGGELTGARREPHDRRVDEGEEGRGEHHGEGGEGKHEDAPQRWDGGRCLPRLLRLALGGGSGGREVGLGRGQADDQLGDGGGGGVAVPEERGLGRGQTDDQLFDGARLAERIVARACAELLSPEERERHASFGGHPDRGVETRAGRKSGGAGAVEIGERATADPAVFTPTALHNLCTT